MGNTASTNKVKEWLIMFVSIFVVWLSLSLSLVSVCLSLSPSLSLSLSLSLSVCLSLSLSPPLLSVCLCVSLYRCLSVFLAVSLCSFVPRGLHWYLFGLLDFAQSFEDFTVLDLLVIWDYSQAFCIPMRTPFYFKCKRPGYNRRNGCLISGIENKVDLRLSSITVFNKSLHFQIRICRSTIHLMKPSPHEIRWFT